MKERDEKNSYDGMKWVNEISYENRLVNVLEYIDTEEEKPVTFQ